MSNINGVTMDTGVTTRFDPGTMVTSVNKSNLSVAPHLPLAPVDPENHLPQLYSLMREMVWHRYTGICFPLSIDSYFNLNIPPIFLLSLFFFLLPQCPLTIKKV